MDSLVAWQGTLHICSCRGALIPPSSSLLSNVHPQVLFSIYHHTLHKFVDGPCPIPPGNIDELTLAFKRIAQTGLADHADYDEETLNESRPGSPAEAVEALSSTDPRAVDFQNQFRNWCVPDTHPNPIVDKVIMNVVPIGLEVFPGRRSEEKRCVPGFTGLSSTSIFLISATYHPSNSRCYLIVLT